MATTIAWNWRQCGSINHQPVSPPQRRRPEDVNRSPVPVGQIETGRPRFHTTAQVETPSSCHQDCCCSGQQQPLDRYVMVERAWLFLFQYLNMFFTLMLMLCPSIRKLCGQKTCSSDGASTSDCWTKSFSPQMDKDWIRFIIWLPAFAK